MKINTFFISLFALIVLSQKIKAQGEFKIRKASENSFVLTKPVKWPNFVTYDPQRTYSPKTPLTAVFIEFGDGGFTFDFNPTRNFRIIDPAKTYTALAMATGIYDTIIPPRPRRTFTNEPMPGSPTAPINATPVLAAGKLVKITSSARTIKRGEDIVYVITYKASRLIKDGKIVFYYDNKAFSVISNDSKTEYGDISVKSTRSYDGENITCSSGTENIQTITTRNFKITEEEKNIFITLRPLDKGLDDAYSQTTVYTEVFNSVNNPIDNDRLSQQVGDIHDPNWIKANNIYCFERNSNWPLVNKPEISYTLHFENTGTRGVRYCSAEISLPSKVAVSDIRIESIIIGSHRISFQDNLINSGTAVRLDKKAFPISVSYFYENNVLHLTFKTKTGISPARSYVLGASPRKGSKSTEHTCTVNYRIGTSTINPELGARISGDEIEGTYWNYIRSFAKIKFENLEFLVTGKSELAAPCPDKLPNGVKINERSIYNRN
jgi:hypothetical protein